MSLNEASLLVERIPKRWNTPEGQAELRSLVKGVKKIRILSTLWYPEIIEGLEKSSNDFLFSWGFQETQIERHQVPGAFELPLASKLLSDCDFMILLGCVIDGETPHFDYVCKGLTEGLMNVQLERNLPMGFGVLTVSNQAQAIERRLKGAEAAQAAFLMYALKEKYGIKT